MLPGNIQKFFIEFRLSEIVTLKESYNRNRGKFFFPEFEGGREETVNYLNIEVGTSITCSI